VGNPVTGITPPSGTGGGTVKPQAYFYNGTGQCVDYPWFEYGGIFDGSKCTPGTLGEKQDDFENDTDDATGGDANDVSSSMLGGTAEYAAARDACDNIAEGSKCRRALKNFINSPLYKSMTPEMRVRLMQLLTRGLGDGTLDLAALQALNRVGANYVLSNNSGAMSLDFIGGNIGGAGDIPIAPSQVGSFLQGISTGLNYLFAVAAGTATAAATVATTPVVVTGAIIALALLGVAVVGKLTYDRITELREDRQVRLNALTYANSYEKDPCTSGYANQIFALLGAQATISRATAILTTGKGVGLGQTIATSTWFTNFGYGNRVGISGPVNYFGTAPVPDKFRLRFSGLGNYQHAEAKILEEFGSNYDYVTQSMIVGQMYLYEDNLDGPCEKSDRRTAGNCRESIGSFRERYGDSGPGSRFRLCVRDPLGRPY
jgi:hypothetical protein